MVVTDPPGTTRMPESAKDDNSSAVGDRRGLTNRTAFVRWIAMAGFVLFLLAVILADLFFGFDGTLERLLLMSIAHLLLAPLAFIATLRLGLLVSIALALAAVQMVLDLVQLLIRGFLAEFTFEYVALLVANIALAAVSLLYLVSLYRLRQADRELNDGIVDANTKEKRSAMIKQETNALRAIAIFDIVALVAALLALWVLVDFSAAMHAWALALLGHIVIIGLALLGVPNGDLWVLVFLLVVLIQTALDLLQFTLRLLARPDITSEVLSWDNIITVVLLVIMAAYIVIDVAYITTTFGLISALNTPIDRSEAVESQSPAGKVQSSAASGLQTLADLHGAVAPQTMRRRGQK